MASELGHYLSMRYCPRVRRRNCRCGISQIANRPNAIVISGAPAGVVGRLLATSPAATDLLPDYLSQRFIDSVLPARPRVLKGDQECPGQFATRQVPWHSGWSEALEGVLRASWLLP